MWNWLRNHPGLEIKIITTKPMFDSSELTLEIQGSFQSSAIGKMPRCFSSIG